MKVTFSDRFAERYLGFDDKVRDVITAFAIYVEKYGLRGLEGRNKPSIPKNPHTKKEQAQFAYAQKHCLWHYHIGIPLYVGDYGDKTSECILHYQRFDDEIILIDVDNHPPFRLPVIDPANN